jgi:hypothetical protein
MFNTRTQCAVLLLGAFSLLIVRQVLGGVTVFRSEFLVEDLIVLFALGFILAPSRFKPLIWHLTICSMGSTMALIAWAPGFHTRPVFQTIILTGVFASFAIYNGVWGVMELLRLQKHRN